MCTLGIHQGNEISGYLPTEHMKSAWLFTKNGIPLMVESAEQVPFYLEALLYLLTRLGFIINVPKSVTSPTQDTHPTDRVPWVS